MEQPAASSADTGGFSAEKQSQILRGAAAVFSQDGYEGASMSRIAARAGVSKGTLYNYFGGKAELFAAWVARECEELRHAFDTQDPDDAPSAALRAIGLRMLQLMMSNAGLTIFRMTVAEAFKFPELARAYYDTGPRMAVGFLADWLARQAAAGRLDVADPVFAAEQFFSLCQTRIAMLRRLGLAGAADEAMMETVVDAAVLMFLNTYGAKP